MLLTAVSVSPKGVSGLHLAAEYGRLSLFEGKERGERDQQVTVSRESGRRVAHGLVTVPPILS